MHELQMTSQDSSWIDVQFLKEATEQLIELRRVLKYTYVYAFYLTDTNAKTLFEHNQAMLESHTERLSELCEIPLAKAAENRAEVINDTLLIFFIFILFFFIFKLFFLISTPHCF